jgi:hypothetical protein
MNCFLFGQIYYQIRGVNMLQGDIAPAIRNKLNEVTNENNQIKIEYADTKILLTSILIELKELNSNIKELKVYNNVIINENDEEIEIKHKKEKEEKKSSKKEEKEFIPNISINNNDIVNIKSNSKKTDNIDDILKSMDDM